MCKARIGVGRQRDAIAKLGNMAIVENQNFVGALHRGQAMGNDNAGAVCQQPVDSPLQQLFRRWIEPRELLLLKMEFGLSIAGWTYLARDLGIMDKTTHGKYWGYLRKHGWHKEEPGPRYPSETSRLFEKQVYHALAEDWVSESRAAELLKMPLIALRACRNLDCPSDAAD